MSGRKSSLYPLGFISGRRNFMLQSLMFATWWFFDQCKEEKMLWREMMSILQQNGVMHDVFCKVLMKIYPHISNIIPLKPINWLDLSVLKLNNNQQVVPYKRGPTVTSWKLHLTQTIHPPNNSKTPTLRMIKLSSSLHTLNIPPPYHVSTTWYVKPLVNSIMLWYNPTQQYTSVSRWNVKQYWSTGVKAE